MAGDNAEKTDRIVSLSELMAKDLPPIKWLISELVPEESMVVLAGMSGSYKTWLVMEMAISVAGGQDFLGIFATQQTGVLIIDEESGERLYSERFKLLTDKNNLPIYIMSMTGFIVTRGSIDRIIKSCKEKGVGLVVIDSMTRVHTGDENTSKDVSRFFGVLRELTKEGISALVIHHNRKPGQGGYDASSDMRGSSDIRAAVDIQLAVRRVGESQNIEIRQPKCRYGKEIEPFGLEFHKNGETEKLEFTYTGNIKDKNTRTDDTEKTTELRKTIIETIINLQGAGKNAIAAAVAHKTNIGVSKIKAEISNMVEQGVLIATNGKHNATILNIPEDYEDMES